METHMDLIAFEDFKPGEIRRYGQYQMTAEEIVDFATQFDPQPFHLSQEAGRKSILGGLSASGWHTCSALIRMGVDDWITQSTCIAGMGIEENRWLAPVRPGDVLTAEMTTVAKSDISSRPEAGVVKFATILRDQTGREVLTQKATTLFGRREPLAERPPSGPRKAHEPEPERIDDAEAALPDYYEKVRVGAFADLGVTHFTADIIQLYAEKYDPLPFHMDEEVGRAHPLGALSAAGFHTASCWMGHFIAARRASARGGILPDRASPGFTDMVWRRAVLVGDRISYSTQVMSKRLTSKPGMGVVRSRNRGVNQRGEVVMEFYASVFSPVGEET
jgi:acyl dehydratase